jgi:sugar phosphate isomerase/epimerase
MQPCQVLASTTSHKREPLPTTLEIFARLDLRDIDLNLNHMIERGVDLDRVRTALADNGQHAWIVSGGWCDFFHGEPEIEATVASVARQVAMARTLDVNRLRLFFGRAARGEWCARLRDASVANIQRLADRHPEMSFVFENHDGASSCPDICREILERVDRSTVRMNFDPINFEHAGVDSMTAFRVLQPFIAHVHLKGLDDGRFCEFGAGAIDLTPLLAELIASGYRGAFTVEYEGEFDRTLRLYESVRCARGVIARLAVSASGASFETEPRVPRALHMTKKYT